ncbi:MAG: hypothetical protein IT370_38145 [Deltaproteobacteria bacterium]|nr:hypothetical protein [Deltaproteobacteria bacterium]
MRAATTTLLVLMTVTVAAQPASAEDAGVLEAARSWYSAMLEAGARIQREAPDAELMASAPPVIAAVFQRWNSCKRFAAGSARPRRPHTLAQLASCMAVLDGNGRVPNHTAARWGVVTLDDAVRTIGMSLRRGVRGRAAAQMRRDGKGATIIEATAGSAWFVQTFLAVRADGTVKAVWIFEGVQEMVPDSPSQTL